MIDQATLNNLMVEAEHDGFARVDDATMRELSWAHTHARVLTRNMTEIKGMLGVDSDEAVQGKILELYDALDLEQDRVRRLRAGKPETVCDWLAQWWRGARA